MTTSDETRRVAADGEEIITTLRREQLEVIAANYSKLTDSLHDESALSGWYVTHLEQSREIDTRLATVEDRLIAQDRLADALANAQDRIDQLDDDTAALRAAKRLFVVIVIALCVGLAGLFGKQGYDAFAAWSAAKKAEGAQQAIDGEIDPEVEAKLDAKPTPSRVEPTSESADREGEPLGVSSPKVLPTADQRAFADSLASLDFTPNLFAGGVEYGHGSWISPASRSDGVGISEWSDPARFMDPAHAAPGQRLTIESPFGVATPTKHEKRQVADEKNDQIRRDGGGGGGNTGPDDSDGIEPEAAQGFRIVSTVARPAKRTNSPSPSGPTSEQQRGRGR